MNRWLPHADQSTDLRLAAGKGWAGMLSGYLRALDIEHLCSIRSPAERQLLGEHLMSMLSFALEQNGLAAQPGALGERVSPRDGELHGRMRRWIRDHHADTEVDAQKLATAFNVSVRYVHKVFAKAGRGMTFLETLQGDRLEAAARMLRSPRRRTQVRCPGGLRLRLCGPGLLRPRLPQEIRLHPAHLRPAARAGCERRRAGPQLTRMPAASPGRLVSGVAMRPCPIFIFLFLSLIAVNIIRA